MSLARALAELFKAVRDEAGTNPDFALKLEQALAVYKPSKRAKQAARDRVAVRPAPAPVMQPAPAPPSAPPPVGVNPVSLLQQQGEDALRAELAGEDYSAEALAALAAEHNLDPAGEAANADKSGWIEQIVAQAKRRVARDSKLFDY
jgi:hypothetical protein